MGGLAHASCYRGRPVLQFDWEKKARSISSPSAAHCTLRIGGAFRLLLGIRSGDFRESERRNL